MSFYQEKKKTFPQRFRLVLSSVLQASGLPFAHVLPEEEIDEAFDEEEPWFAQQDGDRFTPPLTLWAFLSQVLRKEEQRSCLAAVSRVIVLPTAPARQVCANNSGGYCKARTKLPEKVTERLATRVAEGCEEKVPPQRLWKGRHVKLADGITVNMPDTEENQQEYSQQASQAEGLGFPIARVVVLLSLATPLPAVSALRRTRGSHLQVVDPVLHAGKLRCSGRFGQSGANWIQILIHRTGQQRRFG